MNKTTFNVFVIGGAGKAGLNLVKGITQFRKTYKGKDVYVTVLRVHDDVMLDEKSDKLLELPNVTVSSQYQSLHYADMIFVGIPPTEEASTKLFAKVKDYAHSENPALNGKIIPVLSYSSGLSLGTLAEAFRGKNQKKDHGLVRLTLNTNMDTGNGIVYYAYNQNDSIAEDAIKFLEPIAETVKVPSRKIARYIAGVGSMNAYDIQYIFTMLQETGAGKRDIGYLLERMEQAADAWSEGKNENTVHAWLQQKVVGYNRIGIKSKANELSKATFLSSVRSIRHDFRVIKEKTKGDLFNQIPFAEIIAMLSGRLYTVPTKNGCTEKNLNYQQALTIEEMIVKIPEILNSTFLVSKTMNIELTSKVLVLR